MQNHIIKWEPDSRGLFMKNNYVGGNCRLISSFCGTLMSLWGAFDMETKEEKKKKRLQCVKSLHLAAGHVVAGRFLSYRREL